MEPEDTKNEIEEGSRSPLSRQPQQVPPLSFHDPSFPNPTVAGSSVSQQEQQQNASQHGQLLLSASSGPSGPAQQRGDTENAAAPFSWSSSRFPGHGGVPGHASRGQEGGGGMNMTELYELQKRMQQNVERQQQLLMQTSTNYAQQAPPQQQQQQQQQPPPPQQQHPAAPGGYIQRQVLEWGGDSRGSDNTPTGLISMQMSRMPSGLLNMYLDSYNSASERLLGEQTGTPTPLPLTATEQQQRWRQPSITGRQHGYMSNQNHHQEAVLHNDANTTVRQIGSGGAVSTTWQGAAHHQADASSSMGPGKHQQNEFSDNVGLLTGIWQQQDGHQQGSDPFSKRQYSGNHQGKPAASVTSTRSLYQEETSHSQRTAALQQQSQLYQQNIDMGIQEAMDMPLNFSNLFDSDDDDGIEKEKLDHSIIHGGFHPMLMNQSSIIPNYPHQQQPNPNQSILTSGTLPQPAGIWQQPQQRQGTSFGLHETSPRGTHSSTNLHTRIMKLDEAMEKSIKSQRMLQAWDTKMGLRKCHSKTMRQTTASRKRVQELLVSAIMRSGATAFLFVPKQA